MELSRYHWVGLLSGVPLFSGAWLAAFYNNAWLGLLGLVIAGVGVFVANRVEVRSDSLTHIKRGLVAGLLAVAVARVLGFLTAWVVGASQGGNSFESVGDLWRVVLNGGWLATLTLLVLGAVVGGAIAALEPEAKGKGRK